MIWVKDQHAQAQQWLMHAQAWAQAQQPLPLKLSLSLSLSMHDPMLSLSPSLSMHEPLLSLSMLVLDPNHPDSAGWSWLILDMTPDSGLWTP